MMARSLAADVHALDGPMQRHAGQHRREDAPSASEGVVGYADYHLPPLLRVGELVEAVPGMIATQHSGTGKANLRIGMHL